MGISNRALSKTHINDFVAKSEDEISTSVELRDHIFEIKNTEGILGFISLYDLKTYVLENGEESRDYSIRNIDSEEWKKIYEHPFFQRRKPQLVSSDILKDSNGHQFFMLIKGQKAGPFTKSELEEKIEKKEILLSDMASINAGRTWEKLFLIDGFDRRTLKENGELPSMPSDEFINHPSDKIKPMPQEIDAISSLAYLGNQKKGLYIEQAHELSYKDEQNKKSKSSSVYKQFLIVLIVVIGYFLFTIKTHLRSPFKVGEDKSLGEKSEMLSPVDTSLSPFGDKPKNQNIEVFDQGRSGKFETRKLTPVRPAKKSFTDSKTFNDSNKPEADSSSPPGEENNYYYDNSAPMELDPVRSQVSKENFDNVPGEQATPESGINAETQGLPKEESVGGENTN